MNIPKEKFLEKVIVGPKCWTWTAATNGGRYGHMKVGGKLMPAHRISWLLYEGPIPKGKNVLHHCDNPLCVNPKHLFIGTQKDNVRDMIAKRRHRLLGAAVLTRQQVIAIRRANAAFRKQLAADYGIHVTAVCRIINRKRWDHSHKR